jgi:XisI protein
MDNPLEQATIIRSTLQAATIAQPRLQAIRIYPICDLESGYFLIMATGWDKQQWFNTILFQAHLVGDHLTIEEDNFEEGLTQSLIEAGIPPQNISNSPYPDVTKVAA